MARGGRARPLDAVGRQDESGRGLHGGRRRALVLRQDDPARQRGHRPRPDPAPGRLEGGRAVLGGEDRGHAEEPGEDRRLPIDRGATPAGQPGQPGAQRRRQPLRGAADLAPVRRRLPVRQRRFALERPVPDARTVVPQSLRPDAVGLVRGPVRAHLAARLRRREPDRALPLQLRRAPDAGGLRQPRADPGHRHRALRRLPRVGPADRRAAGGPAVFLPADRAHQPAGPLDDRPREVPAFRLPDQAVRDRAEPSATTAATTSSIRRRGTT